jgi:hypothetical protein
MIKTKRKMRRKIPLFKVNMGPGAEYSQLTQIPEVRDAVMEETIYAIKDGIEKKKTSITLFEVANSDYYIELSKNNWKHTLEHLIEHYTKNEDYDKCIEVRDLINQL